MTTRWSCPQATPGFSIVVAGFSGSRKKRRAIDDIKVAAARAGVPSRELEELGRYLLQEGRRQEAKDAVERGYALLDPASFAELHFEVNRAVN